MLLTSTQVSVAVSSTIVFTFTIALFLSGYVLQQQTVRGLQAAIKPRLPALALATLPTDIPDARGSVWDEADDTVQAEFDFGGWDDDGEYDEDGNGGVTMMNLGVSELKKRDVEDSASVGPEGFEVEAPEGFEVKAPAADVALKKRETQDTAAQEIEGTGSEDGAAGELKKRAMGDS